MLRAFVVTVLAGPLAAAAVDIQSALAAIPGISWLSAGVGSLLLVVTAAGAGSR